MKFYKICSCIFLFSYFLSPLIAQNNYLSSDLVKAMMEVYEEQLKENPRDYVTFQRRANDYFNYGEMDKALDDITNAIKYFPRKEKIDLSQAYLLRAKIYADRKEYRHAFTDLNSALNLNPSLSMALKDRADLLYKMELYEDSKKDYNTLLRMDARNQEAYMGLARIEAREGNMVRAKDMLSVAVNLSPSSPDIYVRRAEIYDNMGLDDDAIADLLYAIILDDSNTNATQAIIKYCNSNYEVTMNGLNQAIARNPGAGMLYYLRAVVEKNNNRYSLSAKDWNTIIEKKYFYYHTLFYNRSLCYFHLAGYQYALDDILSAITMDAGNPLYYLHKSAVLRAMGNYKEAVAAAQTALEQDSSSADAAIELSRGMSALKNYDEARMCLNEAIANNAEHALGYLMRGYLTETQFKDKKSANLDYERVVSLDVNPVSVRNYKGFALARLGRTDEAAAWIDAILANHISNPSGEDYYYAACLYAQLGETQLALEHLEEAFKLGYGDFYNVRENNDPVVSLAPIRKNPRFEEILLKYKNIF